MRVAAQVPVHVHLLNLSIIYLLLSGQTLQSTLFPTFHFCKPPIYHYSYSFLAWVELKCIEAKYKETLLKKNFNNIFLEHCIKTAFLFNPDSSSAIFKFKKIVLGILSGTQKSQKITRFEAHDTSIIIMRASAGLCGIPRCLTLQNVPLVSFTFNPGHPDRLWRYTSDSRANFKPSHILR